MAQKQTHRGTASDRGKANDGGDKKIDNTEMHSEKPELIVFLAHLNYFSHSNYRS